MGGKAAVECLDFGFAAQVERSPAAILGSVLKQAVGGQFLQVISVLRRIVHLYALMPLMSVRLGIG